MSKTNYGTEMEEIAEFILGFCSMGVAAECPEEEHIRYLVEMLEDAPEGLLYYLSDATENSKS